MKTTPISYDTTLTLPQGAYQMNIHESPNFGVYIDNNKKIKLLFLSDIELIDTGVAKLLTLFNEGESFGVRIIDADVNLKEVVQNYNVQDLSSILEEKDVIKQVYDFLISEGNYAILDSLISNNDVIETYFYQVKDKQEFFSAFENEFKSLLEDKDNSENIELLTLFQLSNLTYFDVFPFMEKFETNSELDIIPGTSFKKLDLLVRNT